MTGYVNSSRPESGGATSAPAPSPSNSRNPHNEVGSLENTEGLLGMGKVTRASSPPTSLRTGRCFEGVFKRLARGCAIHRTNGTLTFLHRKTIRGNSHGGRPSPPFVTGSWNTVRICPARALHRRWSWYATRVQRLGSPPGRGFVRRRFSPRRRAGAPSPRSGLSRVGRAASFIRAARASFNQAILATICSRVPPGARPRNAVRSSRVIACATRRADAGSIARAPFRPAKRLRGGDRQVPPSTPPTASRLGQPTSTTAPLRALRARS